MEGCLFAGGLNMEGLIFRISDLCEDTYKMEITKDCLGSTTVNKSLWGRKKTFLTDLRF